MHLYSHLVIAHAMLPTSQPREQGEYYWGAVAPDIRYLVGMRRRATHVPILTLCAWEERWPDLQDFIQGYRVHLLTDERDGAGVLYARIPLRAVRRRLPRPLAAVLLEAAYTERVRLNVPISGRYNPILAELGVSEEVAAFYADAANRYVGEPSFSKAMTMLAESNGAPGASEREAGAPPLLAGNQARLERYVRIVRWMENHPRLRKAIIERVDVNGVTGRIVADLEKMVLG